jgi:endothelin-converting enzyme
VKQYYQKLEVSNSYFSNVVNRLSFSYEKQWDDLVNPVDKNRWTMTAPTVNANYIPVYNKISFPAGIMQLPGFSLNLPDYISYGGFGSVSCASINYI